ncbi:MAG: hypothetical protein AUG44_09435 [Actinobacteria bacterium 13_1_20CM_3_71_11]|nr:MAG: hypothetical protein AUG44_09435 [Actinobacteria bacterium 13_1_20CM_3_71_11]
MSEVTAVDAVIAGGGLAEDGTVTVEGRRVNGAWVFDSVTGPAAHPPVDAAPGRLTLPRAALTGRRRRSPALGANGSVRLAPSVVRCR